MAAYLVLGLVNGLSYALLAAGLVLVYKAGRFLNFAHAQLGVLSALLLGKMVLDWNLPWGVAFPLAVALGAIVGAATEVLIIRRLAERSRISLLIATIGISQILLAVTYWSFLGPNRKRLVLEGYPLPFHAAIDIGALRLGSQHILILVLVPILATGLAIVFHRTLLGRAIRAAASNPEAAGLAGISVRRLSTIAWAVSGSFAAISAILQAPGQAAFDTEALGPSLLLRALGAAAIGGFTSLPLAFAGGTGLGILESIVLNVTGNAGVAQAWMLVAILGALVIRGRSVTAAAGADERIDVGRGPIRVPDGIRTRFIVRRQGLLLGALATFVALIAPMLPIWQSSGKQFLLALTVVFALVGVSLTILTGWAGQVSLGHFAFVGAGALVGARFIGNGWSLPATVLLSGAIGAFLAVAIGLPALRLSGLTLAVTTLGFAVVGPSWLFRQRWFAPATVNIRAPNVALVGSIDDPRSVYYCAVIVLALALVGAGRLRRSAPGRLVLAVRDNPAAAASFGASPTAVKLSAFALSGFIATSAGVLWLAAWRSVSLDLLPAQQSLLMLSIPVVGGVASLSGGVLGAIAIFGIPALTSSWTDSVFSNSIQLQLFLGGGGLIATQISNPGGIAEVAQGQWERFLRLVDRQDAATGAQTRDDQRATSHAAGRENVVGVRKQSLSIAPVRTFSQEELALRTEDVTVAFGGVTAVDGVSISVQRGEIVGLIGANGAGKTTLLNAISGRVKMERGRVIANGRDIAHLAPEFRPHHGVARSFQDARLFPSLTVRETIQVGRSRRDRTGFVASMVGAPWVRWTEKSSRARVDEIITELGLTRWADTQVALLSTGTRRICDLGAQIACDPDVLLLDEPTAGVAQRDAEQFGPLLRRLANDNGWSILIIEHDMPLMLGLADRIYCLERGRVISEGAPMSVRNDPAVIASYLGTDQVAISRSDGAATNGKNRQRRRKIVAPTLNEVPR